MRLSPIDVMNRTFQRSIIGGANLDELADFQADVAATLEELITENAQLRETTQQLNQQVQKYARMEESLQSALLMAQRAAEGERANARREAELTVREADRRARELMEESRAQLREVEDEISRVRRERERFEAEFAALLQGYMSWLRSSAPKETPPNQLALAS